MPQEIDALPARVATKIRAVSSGCWEWTAYRQPRGYGVLTWQRKPMLAHRFVFAQLSGPIPEGLTLDHLCRNPACVNPSHLEPVPMRTNILRSENPAAKWARRTHCDKRHEFTPDNTEIRRGTRARVCKRCRTEAHHRRMQDPAYRARVNANTRARRAAKPKPARDPKPKTPNANARKTHCRNGHEFNAANTRYYHNKRGGVQRFCRACNREWKARPREP